MRIAIIGGVESTALLIRKVYEHGYRDVKVWAYSPLDISKVSGWDDLMHIAGILNYAAECFQRVAECYGALTKWQPDLIFVVGLSQLIPDDIIHIPRFGCIGFHPTKLPHGRGRAPVAWILLDGVPAAATFFRITGGVDDGPIIEQETIFVEPSDDAFAVHKKILDAMSIALDRMLPSIADGRFKENEQDNVLATWYGRRAPDDGVIRWEKDASEILKHIRATTKPHPGAFTFYLENRITIWNAELCWQPIKGVEGKILSIDADGSFVVQCGHGLIRIIKWSCPTWRPCVGRQLGFLVQVELASLRERFFGLEAKVAELERRINGAENVGC
jgi:methionyl-tRNA formyltransferase